MVTTAAAQARLDDSGHVLVAPSAVRGQEWARDFFGTTITPEALTSTAPPDLTHKTVYLSGDTSGISERQLHSADRVFAIGDTVDPGRVPLRVHGVGVHYRRFFDPGLDAFDRIRAEHTFQSLTESTKPGAARRSGIYLTPVARDGDTLRFRLLRCSTNLSGPTENFGPTDTRIVDALDREAATVFRNQAPLNHVLAQIYHNTPATAERKQSKARISAHADKTKDMPVNGIMAFCTFYDRLDHLEPLADDPFDVGWKGVSALTRLRFHLKDPAAARDDASLPERFTVTLHPGSVFFMPLSTNRQYTHEIRPSGLDAARIPTRLGYVVRCSKTEAVHENGDTYLTAAGGGGGAAGRVRLEPPTEAGMDDLRRLYAEENRSTSFVDYGDAFHFSMNSGDYLAPRI